MKPNGTHFPSLQSQDIDKIFFFITEEWVPLKIKSKICCCIPTLSHFTKEGNEIEGGQEVPGFAQDPAGNGGANVD